MSLEQDIIRILTEYTNTVFDGNKDRAAKSLGVQAPTFWRWLKGKHIPKIESLIQPFNILNARIFLPGDLPDIDQTQKELLRRISELEKENSILKIKNEKLNEYRIKWEGYIESIQAKNSTYPSKK